MSLEVERAEGLGEALVADFCARYQSALTAQLLPDRARVRALAERYVGEMTALAGLLACDPEIGGRAMAGSTGLRLTVDEACRGVVVEDVTDAVVNALEGADGHAVVEGMAAAASRHPLSRWAEQSVTDYDPHALQARLRSAGVELAAARAKDLVGGWRAVMTEVVDGALKDIADPSVALRLALGGGLSEKPTRNALASTATLGQVAACVVSEHVRDLLEARARDLWGSAA